MLLGEMFAGQGMNKSFNEETKKKINEYYGMGYKSVEDEDVYYLYCQDENASKIVNYVRKLREEDVLKYYHLVYENNENEVFLSCLVVIAQDGIEKLRKDLLDFPVRFERFENRYDIQPQITVLEFKCFQDAFYNKNCLEHQNMIIESRLSRDLEIVKTFVYCCNLTL